jgi:hypothetical protein
VAAAREDLENASEARVNLAVLRADGTLGDVWNENDKGGDGTSAAAWNTVLNKVVNRVEVDDETLLFVPSVSEPVEEKRTSVARGTKTRQANLASKRADERAA